MIILTTNLLALRYLQKMVLGKIIPTFLHGNNIYYNNMIGICIIILHLRIIQFVLSFNYRLLSNCSNFNRFTENSEIKMIWQKNDMA